MKPVEEHSKYVWRLVLQINVWAVFYSCKSYTLQCRNIKCQHVQVGFDDEELNKFIFYSFSI